MAFSILGSGQSIVSRDNRDYCDHESSANEGSLRS